MRADSKQCHGPLRRVVFLGGVCLSLFPGGLVRGLAQSWGPASNLPPGPGSESLTEDSWLMADLPMTTRHQVAVSADYLLGRGELGLPVLFTQANDPNFRPDVITGDRESDFFGATASYSFGQTWHFDFSYSRGESTTTADVDLGQPSPSDFEISDDWYQFYVRYAFPNLRGSRLSAYLRTGVSLVKSELRATSQDPGLWSEQDQIRDVLGNLGAGVSYALISGVRARLSAQLEAEGFFGGREQELSETILGAPDLPDATLDNWLYGGLARATFRFQYGLGREARFNVYADAGMQARFSAIEYESVGNFRGGTFDELLWGPYAKLGLNYSF